MREKIVYICFDPLHVVDVAAVSQKQKKNGYKCFAILLCVLYFILI